MTHRRRTQVRRVPAVGVAAIVLLLGACGGSDDPEPQVIEGDGSGLLESTDDSTPVAAVAGMPDPCSLVTDREVAEAGGTEPTGRSRAQLTPSSAECTFLTDDGALVIVGVDVDPPSEIMSAEQLEAAQSDFGGEPVDDLGETAWWSPVLGAVSTFDGEQVVTVTMVITDQDPDDLREPAIQLAEAALGRL